MLFKRIPSLVILIITHLLLPVLMCIFIVTNRFSSALDGTVKILITALYVILVVVLGYWGYISYYIRNLLAVGFIICLIISLVNLKGLPVYSYTGIPAAIFDFIMVVVSIVLIKVFIDALRSCSFGEKPITMSFPFKQGVFSIIDGGNGEKSSLMNYHYKALSHRGAGVNASMKYATDITRLNSFKASSRGILPKALESYEIYNENIYSPCDGIVVDVVNKYGNNLPFSGNYPYNVGNSIVIKTGDIFVIMGHMEKDSITIGTGDMVKTGQLIGKIGNSGWTNQPHLHMQAVYSSTDSYWQGQGVPILFEDSFPLKNKIYKRT